MEKSKVREVIGELFEKYPDLTVKDLIGGWADWLAYMTTKEENVMGIFMKAYLKYFLYYGTDKMFNDFKEEEEKNK